MNRISLFTLGCALLLAVPALAQEPPPPPPSEPAESPPAEPGAGAGASGEATVDVEIAPEAAATGVSADASVTAGTESEPPPPAEGSWQLGVAPRVGLTVPTSKLGAFVVGGLGIDYVLPVADEKLVVALDLTLTRPSHDGSGTDGRVPGGSYEYEVRETEFKVGLNLLYRFFGPDEAFVPYAGGGPLLHMLRTTETTNVAPGENTAQNTEIGFELVGGADYRVGPGMVLGELRVLYSDLDHYWTGNSNAGNVTLSAGYRFVF